MKMRVVSPMCLFMLVTLCLLPACGGGSGSGNEVSDDPIIPVEDTETLYKGVAIDSLSGDEDSERFFSLSIGEEGEDLAFELSGGSGDADLYIRYGELPTTTLYDCNSTEDGNDESCSEASATAGVWYALLYGSQEYSGVSIIATYSDATGDEDSTDDECSHSSLQEDLLAAHNEARATGRSCGETYYPAVSNLSMNCSLTKAAVAHSTDMAENNFFDHIGSDGSSVADRVEEQGYASSYVGENIAKGYPDVDAVMEGWLGSDGHCANIMKSNYTEMGAGWVEDDSNTPNWTVDFGTP